MRQIAWDPMDKPAKATFALKIFEQTFFELLMFIIIGVRNKWIWGVIPEVNLAGSNPGNGSEGLATRRSMTW